MSADQDYITNTKVTDLNNDCLREIFDKFDVRKRSDFYHYMYFDVRPLIAFMRVSKQWQRVIKEIMDNEVDTIEVVSSKEESHMFHSNYLVYCDERFFGNFELNNVNKVVFQRQPDLKLKCLFWLFEQLPNLNSLNLFRMSFKSQFFADKKGLADLGSKLTSLGIVWLQSKTTQSEILKYSGHLKELECAFLKSPSDKDKEASRAVFNEIQSLKYFVKVLPVSIEKLSLFGLPDTCAPYLHYVIKKVNNNLKHLKVVLRTRDSESKPMCQLKPRDFEKFEVSPNLMSLSLQFSPTSTNKAISNKFLKPFLSLKKLILCNFVVFAEDFSVIVDLVPNVSVLKLDKYRLEPFQDFFVFLESISKLKNLTIFHSYIDSEYFDQIDSFFETLADLLNNGHFQSLRCLALQHSIQIVQLFQAFRGLAERNPTKTYIISLDMYNRLNTPERAAKEDSDLLESLCQTIRNLELRSTHPHF